MDISYSNLSALNLDLTNSPELLRLEVTDCVLNSLNASGASQLATVDFNGSTFETLNLSGTGIPNTLDLHGSYDRTIHHVDVSNCTNLITLRASGIQMQSINLTGCTSMTGLDVGLNNLTSLDLSTLVSLQAFSMENNTHIEVLDLSNSPHLVNAILGYNSGVRVLNIKNGANDAAYFLSPNSQFQNPLRYICVDDSEFAQTMLLLPQTFNPGYYPAVNSYCSFEPGGQYNTITGNVIFDINNNGCDPGDVPIGNLRLDITDGTTQGACLTAGMLDYTFYTQAGNFTVTPSIENPSWFTFSPATATIPFADNNNHTVNQNFCIAPVGVHQDVEVFVIPFGNVTAGFDVLYQLTYKNKGNQPVSGNVTFAYDDAVCDFVSTTITPSSQSTGLLNYNYTNLLPFESVTSYIRLNLNNPTETPPLNQDDQLTFTAIINPNAGDENPSDNQFQLHQTVTNSFDPNDIVCVQGNRVSPSEIGNYLYYVVNFENTGSAPARNIVVKDIIDTAKFDVNSLQLIGSSASVVSRLTGNVAEFILEDINLAEGAHGNVSFKIKSRNTLVEGDTVTQTAGIYFDYNFPVITDPANTIFQTLSNPDVAEDVSIAIYPNPTKGLINIECNNTIKSVQLYDAQGRILQTNVVNEAHASIDISTQSNGIYFIKIISDKGIKVQKIVRE
ncbi:MAG: T9SS type A sorting domain-containing protein [Flavobacterium sp. JAD_PAG50586_2]|nr:MAG: T9SS type A sorting domain-containing protein [Flavobacterium sp. JAD_PAG50586_2]